MGRVRTLETCGVVELGHLNIPHKNVELRIIVSEENEIRFHYQTSNTKMFIEHKAAKAIISREQLIFDKNLTLQKIVDLLAAEFTKG